MVQVITNTGKHDWVKLEMLNFWVQRGYVVAVTSF